MFTIENTEACGIINVYKPKGLSSYDVIRRLKKVLKTRRIGHTGTLDPIAEGVLVVCVGRATRLASHIENEEKVYRAGMILGIETDSYDTTGKVLYRKEAGCSLDKVKKTIDSFIGKQLQVPPMFSAIKVDGQKLYELARKDITVEREPRPVEIFDITGIAEREGVVYFDAKVSKGTYIRSLIHDIGEKLQTGAAMNSLIRTAVGKFTADSAYGLDRIDNMAENGDFSFLRPVEEIFSASSGYMIDNDENYKYFINGNTVVAGNNYSDGIFRIYHRESFLGLGRIENGRLKGWNYFGI